MDLEKDGEGELDGAYIEWGGPTNGWWKAIANNNYKRKTEELGGACIKRRLPPERNHRRENGREKRERKTEADDAGMDGRRIQQTKGKSTAQRRVASLEVGTCRRAENLKKKKEEESPK